MSQVAHWAEIVDKRTACDEFIEWLARTYDIRLDWDFANPGSPLDLNVLLDQFFEVDRKQLDDERRAMLQQHLEAAKARADAN